MSESRDDPSVIFGVCDFRQEFLCALPVAKKSMSPRECSLGALVWLLNLRDLLNQISPKAMYLQMLDHA